MQGLVKRREGRPTKYTPDLINKVDEYIAMCGREQTKLPKKKEFAMINGFSDEDIAEWTAKYPEFSRAIKKIELCQESQLQDDGMYGGKEVNAGMAIFLLKANHGYSDGSTVQFNQQINAGEGGVTYIIQTTNDNKEFDGLTSEPVKDLPVQETK